MSVATYAAEFRHELEQASSVLIGTHLNPDGDALGSALPFTGEGVGKALETGMLAGRIGAEALASGDFSAVFLARYATALDQRYRRLYQGYGRAQHWLTRPGLADLLIRQAAHRPAVRSAVERVLAETAPPGAVFSLSGLLGWGGRQERQPEADPA